MEVDYDIFNQIRQWALVRGLYQTGDMKTQTIKLMEEVGELSAALLRNNRDEVNDAIGDCVVVLTNLAHLHGTTIEECMNGAFAQICGRTGKMVNGNFIKD